jgi:hypothetical protein
MMNFNFNYIFENERVKLWPLVKSDIEILTTFSVNESELWTYSLIPNHGPETLKKYIDHALAEKKAKPPTLLLFTTKKPSAMREVLVFMISKDSTTQPNWDIPGTENNFREQDLIRIVNFYFWRLLLRP